MSPIPSPPPPGGRPAASTAAGLRVVRREPIADGPGGGRLVVLVHGTMDRATSFTRLTARLPDWTVVAYDRRGYAGSAHAGPPATFAEQVEDLVGVLGGQTATVAFGHSFGGDVVLATVAGHPDLISSAVVWEPPQPWLPFWPTESASRGAGAELHPEERAEWFMRRMVGDRVWDRLPTATRRQRRAEGDTLQAELSSLGAGALFEPARIQVPVVVGRGGRSSRHQRRGVRELATSLARGTLAEIPDAGHGAHLTHPGEVAELIVRAAGGA